MAGVDTSWYEMIGNKNGGTLAQLVQCSYYASAVSLEELGTVVISCVVPMVSTAYRIFDRDGNTAAEGSHSFSREGVGSFALGDVLPLEALKPYETDTADYGIETSVTLVTGDTVSGFYTFKASLHAGKTTTELPRANLREQLAAIPIARPGMTEDELRQICLDYIRLEVEVPIQFEEDFEYTIASQKRTRKLLGGKIYAGIPYVSRGAGNLYRIAQSMDPETGILDPKSDIFDDIRYFGNACSGSACMAWARVVTSAYLGYTMFMSEANGFLPVGPYRYPKENVTMFVKNGPDRFDCNTICTANGEQTMFESYARLKPADGLGCCGHVRMNSAAPTVVRNADGTIDGDRSYTLVREQVCYVSHPNHIRTASDGSHYTAQGVVDLKSTFRQLFDSNYIPFTFPEFLDPSKVEPVRFRLAVEPTLKERVLTTNYPISDVFVETDGKRYVFHNMEFFRKEVKMGDIFPEEALTDSAKITCQLYNGQLIEVPQ